MKVIFNLAILAFLFFSASAHTTTSRDTSTSMIAMPEGKKLNSLFSDYSHYFREATVMIQKDSLDQGLQLLSEGVKQLNADKKIFRVSGYVELEVFSIIEQLSNGSLTKGEEQLGKTVYKQFATEPGKNQVKLIKAFLKKHPASLFAERLLLLSSFQEDQKTIKQQINKVLQKQPKLMTVIFLKAAMLYDEQKYNESEQLFTKLIEQDPWYAHAYYRRGQCYERLKKEDLAIANYNKALSLFPSYFLVYQSLGDLYTKVKNHRAAISSYKKLLEINPDFGYARYVTAEAYKELEMTDSALYHIRYYVNVNPQLADGYGLLGDIYYDADKNKEATESYTRAIDLDPKHEYYYACRGAAYYDIDSIDLALKDFSMAYKLDNSYTYAIDHVGDCYYEKKAYEDALQWYQKAVKTDREYKYSYVGLGNTCQKLKKYDDAIKAFKEAIKIDSTYSSALGNLGWTYYCAGNFKECIKYSYKALDYKKEAVYAMFNIPLATLRMGEFGKAKELYKHFIDLCNEKGYTITEGAVEDLIDLVNNKIMLEEAKYILKTYFSKEI